MYSVQYRKNIVTRMNQNQNDWTNSILQYGRLVGKDYCVVFSASGFPYLILYPRECIGNIATAYLKRLRIIKLFQYKNLLLLKSPQIIRSGIQHCNHWEKRKTIILLSYIPGVFLYMMKYFCEYDCFRMASLISYFQRVHIF